MEAATRVLAIAIGGAIGANARYWLGQAVNRVAGPDFPWATLAINVSGSFAVGVLAVALGRLAPASPVRLLILTGFLGGYTTFATFAHESASLWERGMPPAALAYMGGSVAAGFVAVVLGVATARGLGLGSPAATPPLPEEPRGMSVPRSHERP